MHKALFEKITKHQGQIIDNHLKAKGLGKYSSEYSPHSNTSSSGNYDPNALQKLKDSYDKGHKARKNKN